MTTRTVVFVADGTPFAVVLTFTKLEGRRVHADLSVRSVEPCPLPVMKEVQALWRRWIHSVVKGNTPPLPPGWRVSGGVQEAATSCTPGHLH